MVKISLWARSSQEDTIIAVVVIRAAVSADGAGSIRSQGEVEDICVLEEVEVEVDLFYPFLGPPPQSSTVPLNPSGFQEKDQNLKYIFHSIDVDSPLVINLNHHQQQNRNFVGRHLFVQIQT